MSKFNDNAILPYYRLLDDIKNFKTSGTAYDMDENFNMFDTPSHKYFKLMFYFGSDSEFKDSTSTQPLKSDSGSGLLAPTWESYNSKGDDKFYNYNSAWAYLKLNDENERAEKLEQFVTLLSDISSKSPWYFLSVGGLQEALERKVTEDGKLEIADKKLTITCLPDAYDNRIGTLLELYRDVTWSWVHKKEIIPANLRKFDMAIYIFETPDHKLYNKDNFKPSYKMIEFHDCEFNYNSIKSAWSEVNNVEGISPKYTIDITYADCYEISYNNLMMRAIGDVILTDMINAADNDAAYDSKPQSDDIQYAIIKSLSNDIIPVESLIDIVTLGNDISLKSIITFGNLSDRSTYLERNDNNDKPDPKANIEYKEVYKPGFVSNAAGQVASHIVADTKSLLNRALLGNIYTLSLTQVGSELSELAKGNLVKTGMTAGQYVKKFEKGKVTETQRKLMAYEKPEFGFDKKKFIHKGDYISPIHVDNIFMDDYYVSTEEDLQPNDEAYRAQETGNIYEGDKVATDNTGRSAIITSNDAYNSIKTGNIYEDDKVATDNTGRKQYANNEAVRATKTGNIYEGDKVAIDKTGRKPIVVNKVTKKLGNIFRASTLANNL
jgi:hypothetical protein